MGRVFHVSKYGNDFNNGLAEEPFLTINKAADIAAAGDRIIVHEGEYREWVKPQNGGLHDKLRIVYEDAEGEHVVIKGSEIVDKWEHDRAGVWKTVVDNELFGDFNPFETEIYGDWLVSPRENRVHAGDVYLNGKSFYEAATLEEVYNPRKRLISEHETWGRREEALLEPELSVYQWKAVVDACKTTIYANFHDYNPNDELVEISVRRSCFFPDKTGLNYITVRGFEMAQAASLWAPPTSGQTGLLGVNWSKGWIIEDNIIHDAKCSGISLGKEPSTGDNDWTKFGRKPGYQYQMEAVFKAKRIGWQKERIGSHIVRNNLIYDCGQTGIVGHMGSAFSEIYGNEIYNISVKREFYGHELGGIKFHAAIDTYIHHNYFHNCSLGMWLDWQAQGIRVSSNIFDRNNRDFMIEVTHGPYIVDNNIFTADFMWVNAADGGAYINNLCGGFMSQYKVLERPTPYHLPHSTEILGVLGTYGGDDRYMNNIFIGGDNPGEHYGTDKFNGSPTSVEEYITTATTGKWGEVEKYVAAKTPVYIENNVYMAGAKGFDKETAPLYVEENPDMYIETEDGEVYLNITLPDDVTAKRVKPVNSHELPMARVPEQCYEDGEGKNIVFDKDLCGQKCFGGRMAGPIDSLKAGKNRVKVWTRAIY